jgi:DNA-binding transcriptional regulator PaaX
MYTRPWDKDSRLILLLLLAKGVETTGRVLADWWRATRRSNKLADQLRLLTERGCVRTGSGPVDDRLLTITEHGRRLVWGDTDPEARWARRWDRSWRLVLFDVPQAKASLRAGLRRKLRALHFGWLQNSVWLSPDPVDAILPALTE